MYTQRTAKMEWCGRDSDHKIRIEFTGGLMGIVETTVQKQYIILGMHVILSCYLN